MRAYWFGMETNFGDMLTPYIIRRMFGVELVPCRPDEAELFGVGSIASAIPEMFDGHILGTGIMGGGERYDWTAFISLFDELNSEILPVEYFELGLSDSPSKFEYYRSLE
jgi:hypothetical protein